MATTTNYGWDTPDDTDLVKDGAAAIRTLGSSVDTTTKALNPSTTLGDVEYRSATANTNTRLGIGTTGQVLTVAGGVPTWAAVSGSSMTSIASGTLSGSTVSLTSIVGTYRDLRLVLTNPSITNTGQYVYLRFNNDTTATNYSTGGYAQTAGSFSSYGYGDDAIITNAGGLQPSGLVVCDIPEYAQTSGYKFAFNNTHHKTDASTFKASQMLIGWESTSAINRIDIIAYNTTFTGGTYTLYGVN
jgi:hypothetical protein